jgi:hypothetical protein
MHYVYYNKLLIINNLTQNQIEFLSHFRLKNRGIFPFLMKPSCSCILLISKRLSGGIKDKISHKSF